MCWLSIFHNFTLFPLNFSEVGALSFELILSWLGIFIPMDQLGERVHLTTADSSASPDCTEQDKLLHERKVPHHSVYLYTCNFLTSLFHPYCILRDFPFSPSIDCCIIDLSLSPWSPYHHPIRLYCLLFLKPKPESLPWLQCPASYYFISLLPIHKPVSQRNWLHMLSTIFISYLLINLFWPLSGTSPSFDDHIPGQATFYTSVFPSPTSTEPT